MTPDADPVAQLTFAMLLSAERKTATEIWIRFEGGRGLASFKLDDAWHDELELPLALHQRVIELLGTMASLPPYGDNEFAQGTIVLDLGDRSLQFEIRVRGRGTSLETLLRR
jgi:type II secretory ATPase GspE/PulE/Tfp pilus assembly ATPase PilB-like protein